MQTKCWAASVIWYDVHDCDRQACERSHLQHLVRRVRFLALHIDYLVTSTPAPLHGLVCFVTRPRRSHVSVNSVGHTNNAWYLGHDAMENQPQSDERHDYLLLKNNSGLTTSTEPELIWISSLRKKTWFRIFINSLYFSSKKKVNLNSYKLLVLRRMQNLKVWCYILPYITEITNRIHTLRYGIS